MYIFFAALPSLRPELSRGTVKEFETLVKNNVRPLIGFFRYLGAPLSLHDDLVQETFLKAFRSFERYDSTRPFIAWLLSIARNVFNDQRAEFAKKQALLKNVTQTSTTSFEETSLQKREIEELLAQITEEDRFLIELRIIRSLPFSEVAEIIGQNEGALRVRLHRTLAHLRQLSDEEKGK
ncbi:MAG: sigma-70 family RNA polymerase sigma factor [Candidatus Riflebacteria bacterium]|nr:sigma-70 family RNA polymerase sigma factor [Candidatus Riflebacteria bacterium]